MVDSERRYTLHVYNVQGWWCGEVQCCESVFSNGKCSAVHVWGFGGSVLCRFVLCGVGRCISAMVYTGVLVGGALRCRCVWCGEVHQCYIRVCSVGRCSAINMCGVGRCISGF